MPHEGQLGKNKCSILSPKKEFLPPANEVWGRVIFSQACVIPSVHKGEGGLAS